MANKACKTCDRIVNGLKAGFCQKCRHKGLNSRLERYHRYYQTHKQKYHDYYIARRKALLDK